MDQLTLTLHKTKDGAVIQSVYIDKDALGDVPPATLQVVISPQEASLTGEPRWGVVPVTIDELGFVPLSTTGAELLFEVFSQRYERGSVLVTTNLPFDEWTDVFGSERLTGALLDRLTHHVHILEMNGDSYRLKHSRQSAASQVSDDPVDS